jgi:hypothetical protein
MNINNRLICLGRVAFIVILVDAWGLEFSQLATRTRNNPSDSLPMRPLTYSSGGGFQDWLVSFNAHSKICVGVRIFNAHSICNQ